MGHGPAAVVWAVVDKGVDDYLPVVEMIDNDIQEVEQEIFNAGGNDSTQRIYFLELLTSILEANLALLSVRQNDVIRAISAWAAIIAVPTFLASIWGMNFEYMPELDERFGYALALGLMVVAILGLHRYFKRIDWL